MILLIKYQSAVSLLHSLGRLANQMHPCKKWNGTENNEEKHDFAGKMGMCRI